MPTASIMDLTSAAGMQSEDQKPSSVALTHSTLQAMLTPSGAPMTISSTITESLPGSAIQATRLPAGSYMTSTHGNGSIPTSVINLVAPSNVAYGTMYVNDRSSVSPVYRQSEMPVHHHQHHHQHHQQQPQTQHEHAMTDAMFGAAPPSPKAVPVMAEHAYIPGSSEHASSGGTRSENGVTTKSEMITLTPAGVPTS